MPAMTEAELADAIAQRQFGAVTLDTSVFDRFGCNLQTPALRALGPVGAQHDVHLVFSEVTVHEVQAHRRRAAEEHALKLKAALNQYRRAWRRTEPLSQLAAAIDLDADASQLAAGEWDTFTAEIGAHVLSADGHASFSELVRRYFSAEAPFAQKEGKKNEFPDAIALLTLESWAESTNVLLLTVSGDADWKAYAETSPRLVWTSDLDGALDLFNQAGHRVAERAVELLAAGDAPELSHEIELEIQAWLDDADFEVEASSDFYYDVQPESAVLQTWEIVLPPKVLAVQGEDVTFSLELDCLIEFRAEFDLSVRDSFDRDYVRLNTQAAEKQARHRLTLAITINRSFDAGLEVIAVEANRRRLRVDFGNVELQWSYEE